MVGFAVSKKVAANVQLIQTSTLNIKHKTQMVHMPKVALQAIFFYWRKPKPQANFNPEIQTS